MNDHDHDDDSGTPEGARDALAANTPAAPAPAGGGYLTRSEIADANDYREEDVSVPEWGGTVRVKSLSGEERDDFEGSIITEKRDPNRKGKTKTSVEHRRMRAKLVVLAVVHPPGTAQAGQRMFDETDIAWIAGKSAAALDRVF